MKSFLAWVFIFIITFIDVAWATTNSSTFLDWESNPIAKFLFSIGGLALVCWFRVLTVLVTFILIQFTSGSFKLIGTSIVLVAHIWLAIVYIIIWSI